MLTTTIIVHFNKYYKKQQYKKKKNKQPKEDMTTVVTQRGQKLFEGLFSSGMRNFKYIEISSEMSSTVGWYNAIPLLCKTLYPLDTLIYIHTNVCFKYYRSVPSQNTKPD